MITNKKKIFTKNMFTVVMILVLTFCCACCKKQDNIFKTEDYFCEIIDDKIAIYSLTLEGREKEEIIIPPFIDGKEVQFLCGKRDTLISNGYTSIDSDALVRFYAPYTLLGVAGYHYNGTAVYGKNLEAVFYPCHAMFESDEFSSDALDRVFYAPPKSYVTPISYKYLISKYENDDNLTKVFPANISYLFNYENSPNENYYFIDHAEGDSLIRNAPAPERDGYLFDGWYKEAECLNAWNFEVDTTPKATYDENEKEEYQETKLYAKWQVK